MNRDLSDFHEVTEELIQSAAEFVGGYNVWAELLNRAEEFRRANTTPIIFVSADETTGYVTCEETHERRLH